MLQHIPVEVDADSLATLLLLDKEMEKLPEPFRMQPSVMVVIDFDAYRTFCDRYLSQTDYLSTPTHLLKKYLANNDVVNLLRAFYYDMSLAVCKELHFAETYKKSATNIVHFIADPTISMSSEDIKKLYGKIQNRTEANLREYLASKDFELPKYFRLENAPLWEYANVLWFYAMTSPVKWSYELV